MVMTRRRMFYGLVFLVFFLTSGLAMADKLPAPAASPLTQDNLLALTDAPAIFTVLASAPTPAWTNALLEAASNGKTVYLITTRRMRKHAAVRQLMQSAVHVRVIDQRVNYSFALANPLLNADSSADLTTVAIGDCLINRKCKRHFFFRGHDKAARSLTYEFLFLWQHGYGEPGTVSLDNKAVPTSRAGDFVLTSAQIAPMRIGRFWRFHTAVKPASGVLSYQLRGLTAGAKKSLVVTTPRLDRRDIYQNLLATARRGIEVTLQTPVKMAKNCRDMRFPDGAAQMAACLHKAGVHMETKPVGHSTFVIADRKSGFYTAGGLTVRNEIGAFSLGALFDLR